MSGADLLEDGFPHGTVDGYRSGCRGSHCAAVIPCRDVYRRYQGDMSFRRQIDAGVPLETIVAREEADRVAAHQRDRDAARRARRAAASEAREPKASRVPREPREPRVPRETTVDRIGEDVRRLNGEGLRDLAISIELGVSRALVMKVRHRLGIPSIPVTVRTPKERLRPRREDRAPAVRDAHAEGLTDREIGERLGIGQAWAAELRRNMGLTANRRWREGGKPEARPARDTRAELRAAHAEGLCDRELAERLGLRRSYVADLRRSLGLPSHVGARVRRDPSTLMPHGTNASYARGCRCEDCHQAQREYYREWQRKKRAEGIPAEHHGTPYGYQLGCRGRRACPAGVSCTDAMLAAERDRRREAGIPAAAPRVDADPVRAHVRALMDAGMSVLSIADSAGVSRSGLKTLLYGRAGARKGEFPAQVERDKAERLLALGRTA